MLAKEIRVPEPAWASLNWSWVGFSSPWASLNLYVAFNFEESTWVKFKLVGGAGLMLCSCSRRRLFLARPIQEEKP
jgi:intracellular septation protein